METAFTIRELIDILEQYPDDRPVWVEGRHEEPLNVEVEGDDDPIAVIIRGGLPIDS